MEDTNIHGGESLTMALHHAVCTLSEDTALNDASREALGVLAKCLEVMYDCETLIAVQEG